VPATTLSSYAGTYEGGRVVTVESGALVFRRDAARPPRNLVPLNDSTFVLNNTVEVTFGRRADGVMQLVQHLPDGVLFALPRLGDAPSDLAP
jgi:hypothetical protein